MMAIMDHGEPKAKHGLEDAVRDLIGSGSLQAMQEAIEGLTRKTQHIEEVQLVVEKQMVFLHRDVGEIKETLKGEGEAVPYAIRMDRMEREVAAIKNENAELKDAQKAQKAQRVAIWLGVSTALIGTVMGWIAPLIRAIAGK